MLKKLSFLNSFQKLTVGGAALRALSIPFLKMNCQWRNFKDSINNTTEGHDKEHLFSRTKIIKALATTKNIRFLLGLILLNLLTASCAIDQSGIETNLLDISDCEEKKGEYCNITRTSNKGLELIITTLGPLNNISTYGNCPDNTLTFSSIPQESQVASDNIYCFDVAGVCNTEDYPTSVIYGSSSLNGTMQPLSKCNNGKFHIQFRQRLLKDDLCKNHSLYVELKGITLEGQEIANPNRAKKQIQFGVGSHPECGT